MRLTFRLRFHTEYGQSLFLTGNHEIFGDGNPDHAIPLHYVDDQHWQIVVFIPKGAIPDAEIIYHYILREPDGTLVHDWGKDRVINPARFATDEVTIVDAWNHAGFYENAFYTEPFRQVLLKSNHTEVRLPPPGRTTHIFKAKAPVLAKGQTLCLLGSVDGLANWDTSRPILLNRRAGEDFLTAELDLSGDGFPVSYKYGVYDLEQKRFLGYEGGEDRTLFDTVNPQKQTVVNDGFAVLPATTWKGAGVAIPVFSLRSHSSFGVGEFSDLKLLADWCEQTGLKLIQILPVNDTQATHTWTDSYPYAAISAFALHPLYLNLARVADARKRPALAKLEELRKQLNGLEAVDYEAVLKAKLAFVRKIYPSQREKTFKSKDYLEFFERNQHWLVPYATFSYLRDKYKTADFNQWPEHSVYDPKKIAALSVKGSPAWDEIALNYFIQYHLHLQLREATEYLHAKGIILKGDIPIGVYRYGSDAWQQPELFRMEMQAGAPPDAFAVKGQNWGFPTYNWPKMKEDGFQWWKQRFAQMGEYFDAFRIDHILGFFRIWSVPLNAVEGILGYFVPALPVRINEFINRGIGFEPNRFVKPYITDAVIAEIFGQQEQLVKSQFLISDRFGSYSLKPEFATQRQVEQFFAQAAHNQQNDRLREGLYDLISNVILFEVEGAQGQEYHFRFAMETTPSFKHLDSHTQHQLRELYINYFFRSQDDFWMREAMQKLPALKQVTNMLVCGEDLGLVPASVPEVMKRLGLLSLEIQRMPKSLNQQFSYPKDAPYLSVVTPSTHDMSVIRAWWLEDRKTTQVFYNHVLGQPGEAPATCPPWVSRQIILQHLASPAMWSIFQLQDLLGIDEQVCRKNPEDERINVPANPKNYWRYRMHLRLEELLQQQRFNAELRNCVLQNQR